LGSYVIFLLFSVPFICWLTIFPFYLFWIVIAQSLLGVFAKAYKLTVIKKVKLRREKWRKLKQNVLFYL
jgi:hypothetical protein